MKKDLQQREHWSTRLGFILAAAGSAVGLGNIWRFPYVTGTQGGAAFLLIYLIAIILIGYPVMVTEMTMGKVTQRNPVGAFKKLAEDTSWYLVGGLGVLTGFVILSFYSVVAGWSLHYMVESITGLAAGADYEALFGEHISSVGLPIFYHAIFMFMTAAVIAAGVVKGIQKAVKTLMPILFVLLVILIFRSVTLEGAAEGLSFYLAPDFGEVGIGTLNDAIGQAFFTLSLGMGAIITYGSYLSKDENIGDNAAWVVGLDTLIAIMAGFAIFPAVFALGLDPATGPGLTFVTLPAVFSEMPLGSFFGFVFFVMLSISALTSSISLLEVVVAWIVDEHNWARKKAAIFMGVVIFLTGIPPVLGYGPWDGFEFFGMDILDTYDFFADSIFLPLGGLLTAVFAGHVYTARKLRDKANEVEGKIFVGDWFDPLIKYVVPIAIAVIISVNLYTVFIG